ncbi:MAG: peptide MFS transporter [Muribaculaceae bacterium]|nr:peptide MFS transporter [Muribaculaceae bacterium]
MFKNQPKGLYFLGLSNMGERFGYYTMLSILLLFLQAKFGFSTAISGQIYAIFMAVVYFLPIVGGWVADRWNFSKCVVAGIFIMFAGYLVMAIPTPVRADSSLWILFGALALIAIGTGLFKGNLQVIVGDLYNDPRYSSQRDAGFSIFYMAINIGSMFAPGTASAMCNFAFAHSDLKYVADLPAACNAYLDAAEKGSANLPEAASRVADLAAANGMDVDFSGLTAWCSDYLSTLTTGYNYGFGVACISLIISYAIYMFGKRYFGSSIPSKKKDEAGNNGSAPVLTPRQTRDRMVALLLVFAVVIFFWMVFNQSGAALTEFAKSCIGPECGGFTRIFFNVWALVAFCLAVYAIFGIFQSRTTSGKTTACILLVCMLSFIVYFYATTPNPLTNIQPQDYQQFNPFFVVALTPVSLALFGWLASKGKEPSAPRKIGYGMILAALAYGLMALSSIGISGTSGNVNPNWLISTYLILTFAELLLSPMGISFVSKVAPPKYKGAMMGAWFGATAIGNYLVMVPMLLWGKISLVAIWSILIGLCLISAIFIFSIMRKLENVTAEADAAENVLAEEAAAQKLASDVEA